MKQSVLNIVALIVLILQAVLDAFSVFNFDPEFKQWALVILTGSIVILNGVLSSFKEVSALTVFNILAFVLFVIGGFIDQVLNLVPNMSEAIKVDLLTALGLISNIVNLILKRLKNDQ